MRKGKQMSKTERATMVSAFLVILLSLGIYLIFEQALGRIIPLPQEWAMPVWVAVFSAAITLVFRRLLFISLPRWISRSLRSSRRRARSAVHVTQQ